MAWLDEALDYSEEELKAEFPMTVTKNLRQSEDGKKIAILNDFPEGTQEYRLADPKAEEDDRGKHVFFHAFFGKDAIEAKRMIRSFLTNEADSNSESIMLFREEPNRLFSYAKGYICRKMLQDQNKLRTMFQGKAPAEEVFVLPLKRYMHQCPVCRQRTLLYRGVCEICQECGWEDDGTDNENERPFLAHNDELTIKEYREQYLKRKAANPSYAWYKD